MIPTAAILSGALLLRHPGEEEAAEWVERPVAQVISKGEYVAYCLKPNRDDSTALGALEMAEAIRI